jgi:3-methyl-2-oxobutanoate hydroxymethyltransferase
MKRDGQKIVGVVLYDYQMARIVDRAGVDLVSVGDSVGMNMWGQASEHDITVQQMLLVCTAVRRGVTRALVSCDVPVNADPLDAALVLTRDGGADLVKIEADAETIRRVVDAGVMVWAQISGDKGSRDEQAVAALVGEARALERAGASMIDFRHSGPVAGAAVAQAVSVPVLGGLGGGPWLDGRIRAIVNAIGYSADALTDHVDRYANVARIAHDAVSMYAQDVRSARQIKGK